MRWRTRCEWGLCCTQYWCNVFVSSEDWEHEEQQSTLNLRELGFTCDAVSTQPSRERVSFVRTQNQVRQITACTKCREVPSSQYEQTLFSWNELRTCPELAKCCLCDERRSLSSAQYFFEQNVKMWYSRYKSIHLYKQEKKDDTSTRSLDKVCTGIDLSLQRSLGFTRSDTCIR